MEKDWPQYWLESNLCVTWIVHYLHSLRTAAVTDASSAGSKGASNVDQRAWSRADKAAAERSSAPWLVSNPPFANSLMKISFIRFSYAVPGKTHLHNILDRCAAKAQTHAGHPTTSQTSVIKKTNCRPLQLSFLLFLQDSSGAPWHPQNKTFWKHCS